MPLTWNAILLGTVTDLDTDENTLATELVFGSGATAGSVANPLWDDIATFTVNDTDGDNQWDNNNVGSGNETATLDTDGVIQTVNLDSTSVYNATITYTDGTTANITAVLIQLTDGRVYLAPEFTANADNAALNAAPIRSLTLNSLSNNSTQLVANRQSGDFVPCFVEGTPILTADGLRPVESLSVGDMIMTLDHGPQPLRWVGGREVEAEGSNAPIELSPASNSAPFARPIRVSPHHRILVEGWRAELMFGAPEVLVPAKALLTSGLARRVTGGTVRYRHLLFDRHEILWAGGQQVESLFLGDMVETALEPAARLELMTLLQHVPDDASWWMAPARPLLTCREGRTLAAA